MMAGRDGYDDDDDDDVNDGDDDKDDALSMTLMYSNPITQLQ